MDDILSEQLMPEKVTTIIQIKEALNNKAHITQSGVNEIKKAHCTFLVETVTEQLAYHYLL